MKVGTTSFAVDLFHRKLHGEWHSISTTSCMEVPHDFRWFTISNRLEVTYFILFPFPMSQHSVQNCRTAECICLSIRLAGFIQWFSVFAISTHAMKTRLAEDAPLKCRRSHRHRADCLGHEVPCLSPWSWSLVKRNRRNVVAWNVGTTIHA